MPQNPWDVVSQTPAPSSSQNPWAVVSQTPAQSTSVQGLPAGMSLPPAAGGPSSQPMQKTFEGRASDAIGRAGDAINQGAVPNVGIIPSGVGAGVLKSGLQTANTAVNPVGDQPKSLELQGGQEKLGAGLENIAEFVAGDEALKGLSLGDRLLQSGKIAKAVEKSPRLARALEIGMNAIRTGGVGTGQGLAHGQSLPEAAKTGAIAAGTGAAVETVAEGVNAISNAVKDVKAVKPTPVTQSAADTVPKAKPLQAAGEQVQTEAQAARDVAGKKVASAQEGVKKSVPKNITTDEEFQQRALDARAKVPAKGFSQNPYDGKTFDELGPKEQATVAADAAKLKANETGQLPFPKNGNLTKAAKGVLSDIDSSSKLAGIKDPDVASVEEMASHLAKGLDADGNPLSASPKEAESLTRAFNSKIDALQSKAEAGGNATAVRHLKNLKGAFSDDLFDVYSQYGDPAAAAALKSANKEYAQIVDRQTSSPVKQFLGTASPERIPSMIVSQGHNAQSAVEGLVKDLSPEGKQVLRDSVLQQIYKKNELPDGTINMQKARKQFYALGDTAKALYGPDLKPATDYLDAASKEMTNRLEAAKQTSTGKQITKKLIRLGATGTGAHALGAPGAVAMDTLAEDLTNAFMNQGANGAVKIGISPTEKIVLSPTQAVQARPLITKFLKAKAAGSAAAMASAYQTLKNQSTSGQEEQETPQASPSAGSL